MVSVGDKALLFRNRNMMWLEESGSPSIGDKGFLVRTRDANYFLKETPVSIGNKGRLFNINNQYYLRSKVAAIDGNLKWKFNASDKIESGIEVDSKNNIYFGGLEDGNVFSLDKDGSLRWINIPSSSRPWLISELKLSPDEDTLYFGSYYGVHAIDTTSGEIQWNYTLSPLVLEAYFGIEADDNGNIYFIDDLGVHSLNSNGVLRWEYVDWGGSISLLRIKNDHLYAPAYNKFIDFNLSGFQNWSYVVSETVRGGVSVDDSDVIYFGSDDFYEYALNSDGTLKWRYNASSLPTTPNAVGSDGNIYFGTSLPAKVVVLDNNGSLVWEFDTGESWLGTGYPITGFAIDGNNIAFAGTFTGGKLYSITDGIANWSFKAEDSIASEISFSRSGDTLYFGSEDFNLYALE